jgi:DNA-binding winged helix-turn-helix (wHTH) protein/Flp pilus assembly protein TadD
VRRFLFDRFELDERSGQLLEAGQLVPLQPKLHELLVLLLEHPGRLFSREELQERLWPGVHVTDDSLSQAMARLRKVLGEGLLETKRGRGYRLLAEVQTAEPSETPRPSRSLRGLFGREHELQGLAEGLAQHGLVWLSGPPGVGRTTLALAAAAQTGRPTLTAAITPEVGLPRTLQRALRLSLSGDPALDAMALGQALGARGELLVVVDDAQHDPDASALLEQWRQQAPQIRWLVTSRERGSLGQNVALGPLGLQPAVRLLAERAGVALDEQDPAVAELVTKLDGNPLALCLAAPRLRILQPAELLSRLSGRFELLRDAGRSLSAALGSAWAALDDAARDDLQRLAALGRAVPMELAEVLLGEDTLDRLQRLVDASWLWVRQEEGAAMVVLPYNQGAWIERDLQEPLQRQARLSAWAWVDARALPTLEALRRQEPQAEAWLVRYVDVLRIVAAHVPPDRSPQDLLYLALLACEQRGEPTEVLERLLEQVEGHPGLPLHTRGLLRMQKGALMCRRSPAQGVLLLHEAVALADQHGGPGDRARIRAELMLALSGLDAGQALALAAEAEALAQQSGQIDTIAHVAYARVAATREHGLSSLASLEEILARPDIQLAHTYPMLLGEYALELAAQGHLADAETAFHRVLDLCEPGQRPGHQGHLATVLADAGRLEEADALIGGAVELARGCGQLQHVLLLLALQARVAVALGRIEQAERALTQVPPYDLPPSVRASVRCAQGLLALRQGRAALAAHYLVAAAGDHPRDADILSMATIALAQHGDLPQAERALGQVADLIHGGSRDRPAYELALAWMLRDREGYAQQLQHLDEIPGPGREPISRRLMEMAWLRPDRQEV